MRIESVAEGLHFGIERLRTDVDPVEYGAVAS
jgi:hypothetical protein